MAMRKSVYRAIARDSARVRAGLAEILAVSRRYAAGSATPRDISLLDSAGYYDDPNGADNTIVDRRTRHESKLRSKVWRDMTRPK
ncbi:MAG: hypothetical protein AAB011_13760 [Candidatus Eisenbacteria bacterium]